MSLPISKNKSQKHPFRLNIVTVYLVTALLTMGFTNSGYAAEYATGYANSYAKNNPNSASKALIEAKENANSDNTENLNTRHQKIIYLILSAEIAASRHDEKLALNHYLQAAALTKDPTIAEQATQMAINLQAPLEAMIAAELWADSAEDNLQAQLIAMTLFIGQSTEKAMPYLLRAIQINPTQVDQYILEIQSRLSDTSAKKLKEALNQIASLHPNDAYIHLVAAQSAAQFGEIQNANRLVDKALQISPDLTHAVQLKARLIRHGSNSDASALEFLATKVKQFPDNKELRLFYAHALIDNENVNEAKNQLKAVIDDKKYGGQALVTLGEVLLKENKLSEASENLKKAQTFSDSKDLAQYLLGQTEEQQGNTEAAIRWYADISGAYQIPATLRAVALLKKEKNYKQAIYLLHNANPTTIEEQKQIILAEIDILNASKASLEAMDIIKEVLAKLPDDPEMLYAHATTASKLKRWKEAESSLKILLKQNPNNANALNALGYVLSYNKDRLPEAIQYLKQALSLAPNNPFFMDSIGWAHFRQGNIAQAKVYLQKAFELANDDEIAAHLGEILWADNQKEEAMNIWRKALEKNNDHPILSETLIRLKVDLK